MIEQLDQILHNEGIDVHQRLGCIMSVYKNENIDETLLSKTIQREIRKLIDTLVVQIHDNELFQYLYMYFGNIYFKKEMNQYYTPITICNFIQSLMISNKNAIDPACGTGDLLNMYSGNITLCDKSKDVINLTTYIHERIIQHTGSIVIREIDSLRILIEETQSPKWKPYTYCVLNPPFGNKTIMKDKKILKHFLLAGHGTCSKQEIGILFIELGMRLIENEGILFVIVPNGYLGNMTDSCIKLRHWILSHYRLLGVIKLPDNTFMRSGTGVGTSILIIEKTSMKYIENIVDVSKKDMNENSSKSTLIKGKKRDSYVKPSIRPYSIFISDAKHIGYILNRKHTPIKYKSHQGVYEIDTNGNKIIDNDLDIIARQFKTFCRKENIVGIYTDKTESLLSYETIDVNTCIDNAYRLDVKRYLNAFQSIVKHSIQQGYHQISLYAYTNTRIFRYVKKHSFYYYIDISCVKSPLYTLHKVPVHELPSRAKYNVQKDDILISKLKGTISFSIITHDLPNIVVSNGFTILRPKVDTNVLILFSNLFTRDFKTQHQNMVTGSLMENVTDEDVYQIYVSHDDTLLNKYRPVLESVKLLNTELNTEYTE